ncbi:Phosphoesterase RecJ domain protein [uncultured delta proteobacterium]|uniref:Phosphoesterase RecJ domain protein n=1 Tax=uncultured delta proteobacterium TaxID=34034 RepID=A0A212JGB8_9DELT|nr:Phosphoesterase RecJ domain protein [uncultured delta proteobacterium]
MFEVVSDSLPIQAVARSVSSAGSILAVTHVNPDGDAVGSLVALGHIAASLHIDVRLYCETPIPDNLNWLRPPTPVVASLDELGAWRPDLVVFLDCADGKRAGAAVTGYIERNREETGLNVVCIDHHVANPNFADVNWVDPAMSATGIMVALLAKKLGIPLSGDLGEALCLAIVSDTGSFSYANTTALALDLTAEIVRNGLSMADFTVKYENHWTLNRMHLWGSLMQEVRLLCDGKVVVSVITDEILERHSAPRAYLEGYASWLRRLADTKVVLLARPSRNGSKISLRSMGDVDVQQIAAEFGGGGHKGAAGIDMTEQPRDAAVKVLEGVCRALGEPCCSAKCVL